MSQQNQISTNSQNQLSKPQNSLINFVASNEQLQVVNAVEKSIRIANLENLNELLKVVSKWRLYIGIPKKEVDVELSIATEFISNTYPHLTLAEIELAFNLSISRKLEDVEFFGYFSPLYIGKVLDSYLYWRKMTMADVVRNREVHLQKEAEKNSRPSPEQQCQDTKDIILEFYNKWKETGDIDDMLNICYNFLRRTKILKLTQAEIDEAMIQAKKIEKKTSPILKSLMTDEFEVKMNARNYCVKKFFEKIDINDLLNNITPEYFV